MELSSIEREVVGAKDNNKALQSTINDYAARLQEALIKVQHLTDINNAYSSDIKIQKHIHNKLKRDLEVSENKRKEADAQLDVERRKIEKVKKRKKRFLEYKYLSLPSLRSSFKIRRRLSN